MGRAVHLPLPSAAAYQPQRAVAASISASIALEPLFAADFKHVSPLARVRCRLPAKGGLITRSHRTRQNSGQIENQQACDVVKPSYQADQTGPARVPPLPASQPLPHPDRPRHARPGRRPRPALHLRPGHPPARPAGGSAPSGSQQRILTVPPGHVPGHDPSRLGSPAGAGIDRQSRIGAASDSGGTAAHPCTRASRPPDRRYGIAAPASYGAPFPSARAPGSPGARTIARWFWT